MRSVVLAVVLMVASCGIAGGMNNAATCFKELKEAYANFKSDILTST